MKDSIKSTILGLGADVCGIAGIDRFSEAPEGFCPTDIYKECESVIVFGVALPKGLFEIEHRLIYCHFNYGCCPEVDMIAFKGAKLLEASYHSTAVPLPSDGPYEYWDTDKMEGRGLISMKHAAVAAGLGTLGKSTLLLNRDFGNRLTLGAILTDIPLESDPYAGSICIEGCSICLDNCPVHALNGVSAVQKNCRTNTYGTNSRGFDTVECNRCRRLCPMHNGISAHA